MVLVEVDLFGFPGLGEELTFNFPTGGVLVVQDASFPVTALAAKGEFSIFLAIEINPPIDQFFYRWRSFGYDGLNDLLGTKARSRVNGVGDVIFCQSTSSVFSRLALNDTGAGRIIISSSFVAASDCQ